MTAATARDFNSAVDALEELESVKAAGVQEGPEGDPELTVIIHGFEIPPSVSGVLHTRGISVIVPRTATRGDPTTTELIGR